MDNVTTAGIDLAKCVFAARRRWRRGGDPYLRMLLVMGARSVLQRAAKESDPLSRWTLALKERRGYHRA